MVWITKENTYLIVEASASEKPVHARRRCATHGDVVNHEAPELVICCGSAKYEFNHMTVSADATLDVGIAEPETVN